MLERKYSMEPEEAEEVEAFLRPFLEYLPEKRISAREALHLPWLRK